MNMIVNSSDLVGYEAETQKETTKGMSNAQALSKLLKVWEGRQAAAGKKVAGLGLLAVSLAACNSNDDTPFAQSDIDTAVAAVDLTSDNAAAVTAALTDSGGTAHASVAAAITSNDAAVTTAATTAALTHSDGTIYATVDAAKTAGINTSSSDAVAAAATTALTDGAGTVHATVDAAITSNDTAVTATATAAAEATLMTGSGFATVAELLTAYTNETAAIAPNTSALTANTDLIMGTSVNDAITATAATYATGDVIADSTSTDNDSFTIATTDDEVLDGTIAGIETVNVNLTQFTNADFTLNLSGVATGTTINVDNLQAGNNTTVVSMSNVASGTTISLSDEWATVVLAGVADADLTLNMATTAAANIQDTGGSTIDTLTVTTTGDATYDVDTASPESVTLTATAGSMNVTADTAVLATLTARDEVVITNLDAATTITVAGTGLETANIITTANVMDVLNISGNGGGISMDIVNAQAPALSTINATGSQDVEVRLSGADYDTLAARLTFTDTTTAGTTSLKFDAASDAGTIDLSLVAADQLELAADFDTEVITAAASGQTYIMTVDQDAAAGAGTSFTAPLSSANTNSITVKFNDDNATTTVAGGNAGTIDLDDSTFSNFKTINLVADDTNFRFATNANAASTLTAAGADVVVTGAGTFTNITAGSVTANSFDASGMTGAVTYFSAGAATARTIKTGSAADTITIDTAANGDHTLELGAGNDTVNLIDDGFSIDGGAGTDTVGFAATADLSGDNFDLTNVEILDIDTAGNAASTVTIDSDEVTGTSLIVISTENQTGDVLDITATGTTVDLSGFTIETADIAVTIDATAYTAVAGVTVTGTNDADTININGGVASTASGGAGADIITGGAQGDTINGGDGIDTIVGAAGVDIISGGEGADIITSGGGADIIDLTETTAATDILITTGDVTTVDVVTGFAAGTGGDEVDIDNSEIIAAIAGNEIIDVGDNTAAATASANATLSTAVTAAFDAGDLAVASDILLVSGSFASAAVMADALETGGSRAMTMNNELDSGDAIMLLYSDGSDSFLGYILPGAAIETNTVAAASELSVVNLMQFVGISDTSTFVSTNFDFVT